MTLRFEIAIVLLLTAALSSGCTFGTQRRADQVVATADQSEWLKRAVHDHGRYYK